MKRSSWVILIVGLLVVCTVLVSDKNASDETLLPTVYLRAELLTEDETEFLRKEIIPSFESTYGCHVHIEIYPDGKLKDECRRQLSSGAIMTDVVLIDTATSRKWQGKDLVTEVTANIGSWTDRKFPGSIMTSVTFDKAVHFVPFSAEANVLCYFSSALQYLPAGAMIDRLSWQQVSEWVTVLAATNNTGLFAIEWSDESAFTRQIGAMILANGGGFPDVGSQAAAETWKLLINMKKGLVTAGSTDDTIADLMRLGDAWVTVVDIKTAEELVESAPGEFRIAPAPRGTATIGAAGIIRGLGVIKGAPQGALAFHLVEFLTSPSVQLELAMGIDGFTPVVDLAGVTAGGGPRERIVKSGTESLQKGMIVGIPRYADWPAVEVLYRSTCESLIFTHGRVDQAVLRKANAEIAGRRRRSAAERGAR